MLKLRVRPKALEDKLPLSQRTNMITGSPHVAPTSVCRTDLFVGNDLLEFSARAVVVQLQRLDLAENVLTLSARLLQVSLHASDVILQQRGALINSCTFI